MASCLIVPRAKPGTTGRKGRSERSRVLPAELDIRRICPNLGLSIACDLLTIGIVALLVRLGSPVVNGSIRGLMEFDDGVNSSGAQHLIAGALPYRDFVIAHPPGVVPLLVPFAALARLLGDARALITVIGATSAVLVAVTSLLTIQAMLEGACPNPKRFDPSSLRKSRSGERCAMPAPQDRGAGRERQGWDCGTA